jgi:BlaI family transcriptional regulator, penicillinase repressor
MSSGGPDALSRRERQIVEVLYARGEAAARDVALALREPDAVDTIRVTLAVLERKGLVRHRVDGRRNVYRPAQSPEQARRNAWTRMTRTFFGGSSSRAILSLLDMSGDRLNDEELDTLAAWVDQKSRERKSKARS